MFLNKTKPGGHDQPGLQVSSVQLAISCSARSAHVLVQEQLLHTQREGPDHEDDLKIIVLSQLKMLFKYQKANRANPV